MTKYYHQYPTCPVCHCPNAQEIGSLSIDSDELVCATCGVRFHRSIDSILSDSSLGASESALKGFDERSLRFMRHGLPWMVEPNLIESSYLDWLGGTTEGQYLITWPWQNVKIIPLILLRYLELRGDGKALIIQERGRKGTHINRITRPPYSALQEYVMRQPNDIDLDPIVRLNKEIGKEYKRFNRTNVLIKQKVVRYEVRRICRTRSISESGFSTESLKKCRATLLEQIKESFGNESIRKITEKPFGKPLESRILNSASCIDLKLIEQEEYCAEKLNYQKKWLWTGGFGLKDAQYLDEIFKTVRFCEPGDLLSTPLEDTRGFFIDKSCFNEEPWGVFEKLLNLETDLVIVQDADWFMQDSDFDGDKSKAFLQFLRTIRKERPGSMVLLFSTDPSQRYHLRIDGRGCRLKDSGVIFHTWDTSSVLSQLTNRMNDNGSCHPNPISSVWSEMDSHEEPVEVFYKEFTYKGGFLDRLSQLIGEINSESSREIVTKYFRELSRSPLYMEGDHPEAQLFRRPFDQGQSLTYDYVMHTIIPSFNPKSFKDFNNVVTENYLDFAGPMNPLRARIFEMIDKQKTEDDVYMTVIVHSLDREGFTQIVKDSGYDELLSQGRLAIHGWRTAVRRIAKLSLGQRHQVMMSVMPPSIHFSLRPVKNLKISFMGDKIAISKINGIIDFRISEIRSRPVHILLDSEESPELLRELQRPMVSKGITNEFIVDFNDEMEIEFGGSSSSLGKQTKDMGMVTFAPGDEAILARNDEGSGILIPIKSSIIVKEDNSCSEINLKSIESTAVLEETLLGKSILYDKQGLFLSFRSVFFRMMVSRCSKVRFSATPYEWKGFVEMHEDATRWNELLEECEEVIARRMDGDLDEARKELANRLVGIGVTARNPDYVRAWWRDYEDIYVEGVGLFRIYSIERPWSQNDMKKIYLEIQSILSADFDADETAERNYVAVLRIQNLRESIMKKNFDRFPQLQALLSDLEDLLSSIIADSEGFKMAVIRRLEIIEPVQTGRIMTKKEADALIEGGRIKVIH